MLKSGRRASRLVAAQAAATAAAMASILKAGASGFISRPGGGSTAGMVKAFGGHNLERTDVSSASAITKKIHCCKRKF
jgi:hypothetical protein